MKLEIDILKSDQDFWWRYVIKNDNATVIDASDGYSDEEGLGHSSHPDFLKNSDQIVLENKRRNSKLRSWKI